MKSGIHEGEYEDIAKDKVFLPLVDKLRRVLYDVVDYNHICECVKWI